MRRSNLRLLNTMEHTYGNSKKIYDFTRHDVEKNKYYLIDEKNGTQRECNSAG